MAGQTVSKPSHATDRQSVIAVAGRKRFVSRGGDKLDHALETFAIPVDGLTCLDAGASTGGFTDCLLQRGAKKVYALDVGTAQLHWKLRNDPRVVVMENSRSAVVRRTVAWGGRWLGWAGSPGWRPWRMSEMVEAPTPAAAATRGHVHPAASRSRRWARTISPST